MESQNTKVAAKSSDQVVLERGEGESENEVNFLVGATSYQVISCMNVWCRHDSLIGLVDSSTVLIHSSSIALHYW